MFHTKTIKDIERLKNERRRHDFFNDKELEKSILQESIEQYWSVCPYCDERYVTDEGHKCPKYEK